MKFNREAKNMLAVMALVLAIAIALNAALVPDADRDMWSWTISLLAVAVALWIWSRRDSAVARDAEAAEEAVQEAEEHAKRTIVRHADERPAPDDLTRVNGIGGVFQTMLNDAGILTYSALASASVEDLEAIIDATGRSRPGRLETWPAQAEFATKADWEGLRRYLDSLQD